MGLLTITPPAVEPVTLEELKAFLSLDSDDTSRDGVLIALGLAAREWCESFCQRRFITQTMRLLVDFFPGYIDQKLVGQRVSSPFVSGSHALLVGLRWAIALPLPPVQSITTFQYLDANGSPIVMNPGTNYVADLSSQPARLTPPFGQMWPVAQVVVNAVQIDYVVGYGDDGSKVPAGIKTAIQLLTNHWYENRLPDENSIPMAVKALLGPYRDLRF
jgi:hypothetical protein